MEYEPLLNNEPAPPVEAVMRLGAYFLIDSMMIFGPDHRCRHDLMASTKVVDKSGVYNNLF